MFHLILDSPLHPYEEVRLRQCMQNSARLQQFGLHAIPGIFARASAISTAKNKRNRRNIEDSESEDPLQDDIAEQDLDHDDVAMQRSKGNTSKKPSKGTSDAPPTGLKFCSRKRIYAEVLPSGCRRSKRIIPQPDASITPSGNHVPAPSTLL
ncbi:hypothetical protein C2845_PM09G10320 [Panicum miliaceum]|uniref:Uncharacterized protein n=1 Tax=Panicum miliaceum TaxID=4540 RepID=A0A3L6RWF5_PANMI|nr:hypothetical protein C2845_PM09G10320 [Panicum miliaceum]